MAAQPSFPRALEATTRFIRDAAAGAASDEKVRSSLRVLCALAREDRMSPERLLIELKDAMSTTRALDVLHADHQEQVRRDIVTFAIAAFYGHNP